VASVSACARPYEALSTAGGFHVPSPAGKIEGGVSLGQYRRITGNNLLDSHEYLEYA
jgi:hypothetical protein